MRKFSVIVCGVLVLVLALAVQAAEKPKTYGNGVAGADTVRISDVLANPDAYVGKTIRVKGLAVGVCEHRGCWVNIASDKEGEVMQVKVKDGEIVFPPAILGDMLVAEGVWTANELTLQQTKEVCAAQARKEGKEFDSEMVVSCMKNYQLSGTGAVVAEK